MTRSLYMVLILQLISNLVLGFNKPIRKIKSYEWIVTTCASEKYPMQVVSGYLVSPSGNIGIESGSFLVNGWGNSGSVFLVGEQKNMLPKQLFIRWFSYTENKFFSGTFDLPAEKLEKMFNTEKIIFNEITIGMAPEGNIVLWLKGNGMSKELCHFLAEEDKETRWEKISGSAHITREEYIKRMLEDVFKDTDFIELKKNGVSADLFINEYRRKYNWIPVVNGNNVLTGSSLSYYNAENENNNGDTFENIYRPVPQKVILKWKTKDGTKYTSVIKFNWEELVDFIRKISDDQVDRRFNIEFEFNNNNLTIFLRSNELVYELKNCDIRTYH